MGIFSKPLNNSLMSSGFATPAGFPNETFDFPSTVEMDNEASIPDPLTNSGHFSEYRSNTGDLFQDTHTAAEGVYQLDYLEESGAREVATQLAPAPGSENLTAPRNAGGIAGTNRIIHSKGPVTGSPDNFWTGDRTATMAQNPGMNGPVIGGADTGHGVSQAFYSQQNAMYSQAMAEAGLMAAI